MRLLLYLLTATSTSMLFGQFDDLPQELPSPATLQEELPGAILETAEKSTEKVSYNDHDFSEHLDPLEGSSGSSQRSCSNQSNYIEHDPFGCEADDNAATSYLEGATQTIEEEHADTIREIECVICQEKLIDGETAIMTFPCEHPKHMIHALCDDPRIKSCPVCRTKRNRVVKPDLTIYRALSKRRKQQFPAIEYLAQFESVRSTRTKVSPQIECINCCLDCATINKDCCEGKCEHGCSYCGLCTAARCTSCLDCCGRLDTKFDPCSCTIYTCCAETGARVIGSKDKPSQCGKRLACIPATCLNITLLPFTLPADVLFGLNSLFFACIKNKRKQYYGNRKDLK